MDASNPAPSNPVTPAKTQPDALAIFMEKPPASTGGLDATAMEKRIAELKTDWLQHDLLQNS